MAKDAKSVLLKEFASAEADLVQCTKELKAALLRLRVSAVAISGNSDMPEIVRKHASDLLRRLGRP